MALNQNTSPEVLTKVQYDGEDIDVIVQHEEKLPLNLLMMY